MTMRARAYRKCADRLGGMWVGLGLACLLLAQPFTYFALGLGYLFAVIGATAFLDR